MASSPILFVFCLSLLAAASDATSANDELVLWRLLRAAGRLVLRDAAAGQLLGYLSLLRRASLCPNRIQYPSILHFSNSSSSPNLVTMRNEVRLGLPSKGRMATDTLDLLKALLHSSHMYHEATNSFAHHGIKVASVEVDVRAMLAQKDKVVGNLTKGIEALFKKNKVNYVKGYGKFLSPSKVSIDTIVGGNTTVKGKHIIVATGSDVKKEEEEGDYA